MKTNIKVGDKVTWHTGFMAGEQGQRDPSWFAEDKKCTVVRLRKNAALLETKDGARHWAGFHEIEETK